MEWKKEGVALFPGYPEHINILANNSLIIRGVKPEDAGQYQCHASNRNGEQAVQAELRVRSKEHLLFQKWFEFRSHILT